MGVPDEVPFIRKEFSDAVARHVYPAMKQAGLRRQGKRTFYEQRPDSSWVLLEIMLYHTTRTETQFSVTTCVWPPGTWLDAGTVPFVALNSPVTARPEQVAAQLWQQDFHRVRLGDDLDAVMRELLVFLSAALEWGRRLSEVEAALDFLTRPYDRGTHPYAPQLRLAIAMLRAVAPRHHRLPELVETFTQQWKADPRPISLRGEIERWRADAGLPAAPDLPLYWHIAMLPSNVERFGWPGSAHRLAGDDFHYADGSKTKTPPPGWPSANQA